MSLESVLGPDVNIQAELAKAEAEAPAEVDSSAAVVVEEKAPEAAPAPEEKAEAIAETKPEAKHVPLAAMLEERKKFQAREAELRAEITRKEQENQQRFNLLQERLDILSGVKQAPPPEPKYEEDPAAFLKANLERTQAQLAQREARDREMQMHQQIEMAINASEQEFHKDHPDYSDAAQHYRQAVFNNIRMFAPDEATAHAQTTLAIKQAAAAALQKGLKPAEVFYNIAKNMGYQPKASVADRPRDDKGQFTKLESIAKGQGETKSLSGGGKTELPLTLDALAAMDPDDIAAFTANDAEWNKLRKLMQ